MNSFRFHLKAVLLVVFSLAMVSIASAQESYVASNGSDGGTCSRTAPCRTIDYALSHVTAGGTVVVLDSGQYQRFTVDKAATVVAAPGVYAEVQAVGRSGVIVNAGTADTVVLRGLAIKDNPESIKQIGAAGVKYLSGSRLIIEDCVVSHFPVGIDVTGDDIDMTGFDIEHLLVRDTQVRQCGIGISITGNWTGPGTGPKTGPDFSCYAKASIEGCRVESNTADGILAQGSAFVTARNTVAAGNGTGFRVIITSYFNVPHMIMENCVASGNDYGINNKAGVVYLSNSILSNNTSWGIAGSISTRGNNTIEQNGKTGNENISGSLLPFSAK